MPAVMGVGAYLKNALCLIQDDEALITHEVGSLDNVEAITRFYNVAKAIIDKAAITPVAIAHDWHPDFPCSRWAAECGLKTIGIQHHHAHVAAVMAEHGMMQPILGLALDGFGLGENKEAWGGELLRVDRKGFLRLGHLRPMPQPGGDSAAREPWRMGAAALWDMGRGDQITSMFADQAGADKLAMMMDRRLNAPLTSSAGRLFDAACGLLNLMPKASFEGEAPMKLEGLVTTPIVQEGGWQIDDASVLDMRPLLSHLIGKSAEEGANLFHGTFSAALLDWVNRAAKHTGISKIALCGGCFLNKVLRESVAQGMMEQGLTPLMPKVLSFGDPAIALGQAYAASMSLMKD